MSRSLAEMPVVVIDTSIICAAAFNPAGVAEKLLKLMVDGVFSAVMSNRLRSEYENTLVHPIHALRNPFLTQAYLDVFLARLDSHIERIPNPPTVFAFDRDPNDEPLINLAVALKADYLVTLDNDLLTLHLYPDFALLAHRPRIVKPGEFLNEIENRRA